MPSWNVLMICGSLRQGSVNEAALRTAQRLMPGGLTARLYGRLAELPHFNPDADRDPLPPVVADLRAALGAADAVLFCTPEYAGALPGAFKNLLDWTIGGGELDRKAVAWINTAGLNAPTGGEDAHASLRRVLRYVGATIVEAACARIPVTRGVVHTDGVIHDPALRQQLAGALGALAHHLHSAQAGEVHFSARTSG